MSTANNKLYINNLNFKKTTLAKLVAILPKNQYEETVDRNICHIFDNIFRRIKLKKLVRLNVSKICQAEIDNQELTLTKTLTKIISEPINCVITIEFEESQYLISAHESGAISIWKVNKHDNDFEVVLNFRFRPQIRR